jgi:hypothetical protein
MKRMIKKSVRRYLVCIILVGVGLPAIIVAGKRIFSFSSHGVHSFFSPEECTVALHDFYCSTLSDKIKEYIAQNTTRQSLLSLEPALFIAHLKKNFPVIKKASYRFIPPKTIAFEVIGTKPLCLANKEAVIGNQRNLLPLATFDEATLAKLPVITINRAYAQKKISRELQAFLHKLPQKTWDTFAINYQHPWEIELIPHQAVCNAKIIASEESIFDAEQFAAIADVFKDLCRRNIVTTRVLVAKNYPLTFDTRIKKYITVRCNYPAKRGRGHG